MNERILVTLALLLAAALLSLAACGGSGDEGKIAATIEKAATTSEPSNCTELETQRFVEQNNRQTGKAALEACEKGAEEGKKEARSVDVSNVSVNGGKATARAKFEGGSLSSQTIEVALVEAEGTWKLDQIEGFAEYDGKALGERFEKQFEEEGRLSPKQSRCLARKIADLSRAEAEEVFLGGLVGPARALSKSCV